MEVSSVGTKIAEMGPGEPEWVLKVVKYLDTGELPVEKEEERKIKRRVARFTWIEGILYKRGFSTPLLKCVSPQKNPIRPSRDT